MNRVKSEYQEKVISKIKKLRMDNNVSQSQISEILSISPGLVGNIESYKYKHKYTLKQIYEICNYFNFSIEYIFFDLNELTTERNNIINQLIIKIIEYDK